MAYPTSSAGLVDYDALWRLARASRPRLVVVRAACSPRLLDLNRFRIVCDRVGALLLADYAQEAGLVAARVMPGPFEYADVVTAACHHTLRGPRAGLLFYRRDGAGAAADLEKRVLGRRRGTAAPHNNVVAAAAVALREAQHDYFFEYQQQVVSNAKALALSLMKLGHQVLTGGTDTHLVLLHLRERGLTSHQAALACDFCSITVARGRAGLRLGSAALTSRGLRERQFVEAAQLLDGALRVGARAAAASGVGRPFEQALRGDFLKKDVKSLREDVQSFAEQFPMPGFDNL